MTICSFFGIITSEGSDYLERENKLNIRVYKSVGSLSFFDYLLAGVSIGILNSFVPIRLSLFEVLMLFLLTDYFIAPFLADKIVESRMKKYIKNNYDSMQELEKGKEEFTLHTISYTMLWGEEQVNETEVTIDKTGDM